MSTLKKLDDTIDLVANKLMTLASIDSSKYEGMTLEEQNSIGFFSRDFGMEQWDWPQGVGLYGLSQFGGKYEDYIKEWGKKEISKGLPSANVNTVCPLLTLMNYPEFESLSINWVENIMHEFARTKEGGIQHNVTASNKKNITENDEQIWADTLFMSILFLSKMGIKYNRQEWINEAIYQLLLHTKYLLDRETGLFYHGWDFSNNSNFGKIFWCRGNCWLTLSIPLFLEIFSNDFTKAQKNYFENMFKNQVDALFLLLDEKKQMWHTLLDEETSYTETSGTAGILAGIFLGIKNGILSSELYLPKLIPIVETLINQVDEEGIVHGVSAGTTISAEREHYKNIIVKPMAYGQALTLYALILAKEFC